MGAEMTTGANPIEWVQLGMGLLGGLALFLFGMDLMTKSLRSVAGEGLKTILAKLTRNRVYGALTGALVTAALNSSSVTTVRSTAPSEKAWLNSGVSDRRTSPRSGLELFRVT